MPVETIHLEEESFKNISTLVEEIDQAFTAGQVVYRGVSDFDYELVPSLFRDGLDGVKETEIFRHFRLQHPVVSSRYPDDWELMSFLRHNGFPVRLLDFSHNILVALYFACGGDDNRDNDSGLYCVSNAPGVTFLPGGKVSVDMDKWRHESYRVSSYKTLASALGIEEPGKCQIKYRPVEETPYLLATLESGVELREGSIADIVHSDIGFGSYTFFQ